MVSFLRCWCEPWVNKFPAALFSLTILLDVRFVAELHRLLLCRVGRKCKSTIRLGVRNFCAMRPAALVGATAIEDRVICS